MLSPLHLKTEKYINLPILPRLNMFYSVAAIKFSGKPIYSFETFIAYVPPTPVCTFSAFILKSHEK